MSLKCITIIFSFCILINAQQSSIPWYGFANGFNNGSSSSSIIQSSAGQIFTGETASSQTKMVIGFLAGVNLSGVTSTDKPSNKIPESFSLFNNYPNPFNPETTIKYSIAKESHITLKIFNVIGEETATLVNKPQPPGIYEVTWNAKDFPSGIYFYQLRADNNFSETKKLILLK